MHPIKYVLPEVIFAEICYFSESAQEEKILSVKIRSFSFIQTQNHYVISYIEHKETIKTITVKKIQYITLKNGQTIQGKYILKWLDSLKSTATKEDNNIIKKSDTPLDFTCNWLKNKKVVITGDAINEDDQIVDRKEVLFPLIRKFGADPKTTISGQTDILITIGSCEGNTKYIDAKKWGIHIVDFAFVKDLYQIEFNEELKLY